tara:strand:- start:547 stop:771 length:225 start_codon:yes stop_codon:yes gene_type:complete
MRLDGYQPKRRKASWKTNLEKMMNLREQYIESLNCALDSCYRDLDYYESIGHQKCIDQVEERIASLKQQIAEAA